MFKNRFFKAKAFTVATIFFVATVSPIFADDFEAEMRRLEAELKQMEIDNQTQGLPALVGVWEGSYFAGQGETGLTLTVFRDRDEYRAIFSFYNMHGRTNAATGKYFMRVSYSPVTKRYSLVGFEWIQRPSGYGFADLEGTITGDVFSGYVVIGNNRGYSFRVNKK
jgi:hypothetical protein